MNRLSEIYGSGCPSNLNATIFDLLLSRWHDIAIEYDIRYSITFGTLLGWYRHETYIPYSKNIQVHVGSDSINPLLDLVNYEWCSYNNQISPIKPYNPYLVLDIEQDPSKSDSEYSRTYSDSEKNFEETNAFRFNGQLGRLIYKNVSLDIYGLSVPKPKSSNAEFDSFSRLIPLPEIGVCLVNNIEVFRFSNTPIYLEEFFGGNFLLPKNIFLNNVWNTAEHKVQLERPKKDEKQLNQYPRVSFEWTAQVWNKTQSVLLNSTTSRIIPINQTAHIVLNLCDGESTVIDIIEKIALLYRDVNLHDLKNDIVSILEIYQKEGAIIFGSDRFANKDNGQSTKPPKPVLINATTEHITRLFPDNRQVTDDWLKDCQQVMIRMLKIFDYICSGLDIDYFIMDGTLIGALRHQGFIPYDGDIDVGMLPNDFAKFKQQGEKLLPREIFLQTPESDEYYTHATLLRLRDRYSSFINLEKENPEEKHHYGLLVDLFIWEEEGEGKLTNKFLPHPILKSDVFPVSRTLFEGFYPKCPRYPETYLNIFYDNFKKIFPKEDQHPHEGKASPVVPSKHLMSLNYYKENGEINN